MTTIINNFPEDLVMEILSRVPAVSLVRLRSTSKRWNALIGDGKFAKKHFANAPKHSMVILLINFRVYLLCIDLSGFHNNVVPSIKLACQFSLKDPLSNSSEQELNIRKVCHCDGLLLCITEDGKMAVWNPCSGETRWIQPRNPYMEGGCYALGKSSCNKYKILSTKSNNEYEIYDITSNIWRDVGVTTGMFPWGRGVYVNGNAYWLDRDLLLSFNFSTQRFQSVPLLENHNFHSNVVFTVTREGQQLCMLDAHAAGFNVWMASKSESTGAMSWTKFLTVARSDIPYRFQFRDCMSFLVYEENKVVLSCNDACQFKKNIIHIVGEDKYIQVEHLGVESKEGSWTPVLHSYVPSLVQIQQNI